MLDLCVTIRAEHDAFRGLRTERFDPNRGPFFCHSEALVFRIDVVEVKGAHKAVVPASRALPTGLLDEDPLHLPPPFGNPIHPTLTTADATTVLDDEDAPSMVSALSLDRPPAFGACSLDQFTRDGRTWTSPTTRS
jgi:hypothetical protein